MDIQGNIKILDDELAKLSTEKMTPLLAQSLNAFFGAKLALESLLSKEEKSTPIIQNKSAQGTVALVVANNEDLFPTLKEYEQNHTERNLKKLCLEIQEFCISIYSTLQSEEEKHIYFEAMKKLTTF